jgi:meiotically up-regulated gene 157 (Mug157) protein
MIDRRTLLAGAAALGIAAPLGAAIPGFSSKRPSIADRRFVSPAVEREIARVSAKIGDPELAWMFSNCYPNTLDTTVFMGTVDGKPDAFVITGDIDAMWLRDSSAQLHPYLPLAKQDAALRMLFHGLIARQARSILIDPYANAFMHDPSATTNLSWALADKTDMKPGVGERKWEVDSPCYPMWIAHGYWQATRDPAPFDALWAEAARAAIRTFREQQRKEGRGPYRFQRASNIPSESMMLDGYGPPSRAIGLIHSGFRPSDDACILPFLIPSNIFAVTALRQLAILAAEARDDPALAADAICLADEVEAALRQYGKMRDTDGREIWAYEVDGLGNALFMDDANVPSLSGLAYLGCVAPDDALWRRTAEQAWSPRNPYFFAGKVAAGIGSPHTMLQEIWPMAIVMHALNARDDATVAQCLKWLKASHGGTGFMHESFNRDDAASFTRAWFAWANGVFGELIIGVAARRPALLRMTA